MADSELYHLYLGILIFLTIASLIGAVIKWKVKDPKKENTVKNLNDRIKAWWVMVGVFMVANVAGLTATVLLFLGLSVVALKEFTSLIPSKAGLGFFG